MSEGGKGGGRVELCCRPYTAGYSVSDQIQNLPNCFTTPNKMTCEDDIKRLVSIKFLRPWIHIRGSDPLDYRDPDPDTAHSVSGFEDVKKNMFSSQSSKLKSHEPQNSRSQVFSNFFS